MIKPTVDDIRNKNEPTDHFLCLLKDNIYALQFLEFTLSNPETKEVFFTFTNDEVSDSEVTINDSDVSENIRQVINEARKIHYTFPSSLLSSKMASSYLKFKVGPNPVKNLLLIEKHYFKGELLKSFEFTFPFCAPNSRNSWEFIYELPILSEDRKKDAIDCPEATTSDTFLFADGQLVIHNKAYYTYSP